MKWLFLEIDTQYQKGNKEFVKVLLKLLLMYIQQFCEEGNYHNDNISDIVKSHIHSNFSEKITIEDLAAVANVSTSYLNRIFKQKLNQTPVQYINWFRINIAKQLLQQKELTIEHIGNLVGMEDPKYFSRVFKKYSGSTPRDYRKGI